MTYQLDLTGPSDPTWDVAARRIVREIQTYKKQVDAFLAMDEVKRDGNWIFKMVMRNKDVVQCRDMMKRDSKFKDYIRKELAFRFNDAFADKMVAAFKV